MFDPRQFRLDGNVALVTGAGAGIGRGIALTFGEAGAAIVVSDVNADAAGRVAAEIRQAGGRPRTSPATLRRKPTCRLLSGRPWMASGA